MTSVTYGMRKSLCKVRLGKSPQGEHINLEDMYKIFKRVKLSPANKALHDEDMDK
jgi:hypothetical protein